MIRGFECRVFIGIGPLIRGEPTVKANHYNSYFGRSWNMDPFGAQFVLKSTAFQWGEMISQRAGDVPNLSNGFAA